MAIDVTRAVRLAQQGYVIRTQTIPLTITPKNHLLLAAPGAEGPASIEASHASPSRRCK